MFIDILNTFLKWSGLGLYYISDPLEKLNTADGDTLYKIKTPSDTHLSALVKEFNESISKN